MDIKQVKNFMGKIVHYDTGQMDVQGCSIKDFYLTACILRLDKKNRFYYQVELQDTVCNRSLMIVPLEKVLSRNEI